MKNTKLKASQRNASQIDKQNSLNKELVTRKDIKDTPFTIIGTNGEYFGAMGKYRITETYPSEEEAEKVTVEITWNRITQIVQLVCETMKN